MKQKKKTQKGSVLGFSYFKKVKDTTQINRWTLSFIIVTLVTILFSYFQGSSVYRGSIVKDLIAPIPVMLVLLLISYSLFYLFLRAFENRKLAYRKGYSIFIFPLFLTITYSYITTLLGAAIGNATLSAILMFSNLLVLLFSVVLLIHHLKNFLGVSGFRIVVSLILSNTVFAVFAVLEYVAVLTLAAV